VWCGGVKLSMRVPCCQSFRHCILNNLSIKQLFGTLVTPNQQRVNSLDKLFMKAPINGKCLSRDSVKVHPNIPTAGILFPKCRVL
jgi:hypothetical protein